MTDLKRHYITNAAKNASESLSMAMQMAMTNKPTEYDAVGIQDLVKAVNASAIALRKSCLRQENAQKMAKREIEKKTYG